MSEPFTKGLFACRDGEIALLTSSCAICRQSYLPRRQHCLKCGGSTQDTEAGPSGRLFSFSKVYMPSAHFKPPYSVGLIDLGDNLRVFSPISKEADQEFAVGMAMRARPTVLWVDERGEVDGFEFVPV